MQPFAVMCKQTVTTHAVKQMKPQQLKEIYNCGVIAITMTLNSYG